MAEVLTRFLVESKGTGRVDYSKSIEYAVQPTGKGTMSLYTFANVWPGLATLPYPNAYAATLRFFDEHFAITIPAPRVPYYIYRLSVTTHANALVLCELMQYANYADWMAFTVEEYWGASYGYQSAELVFTTGLKTLEGRYYDLNFAEWSANPTFDAQVAGNGIWEEVLRG
jgi:hypothetical protein